METILEVKDLTKTFGQREKQILQPLTILISGFIRERPWEL